MVNTDEIKEAFKALDKDNNGYIDLNELKDCLKQVGIEADEDTVKQVYAAMDKNNDGKVTLDEFIDIAQKF